MLLLKRVGSAEQQSLREAAIPGDLQRVVLGARDIVGFPNRVVALVGPQGVEVHARIRRDDRRSWLVDIGFALQVQAATPDIGNAHNGIENLTLNSEVPIPGRRILEGAALRSDGQRKNVGRGPARIIGAAEASRLLSAGTAGCRRERLSRSRRGA